MKRCAELCALFHFKSPYILSGRYNDMVWYDTAMQCNATRYVMM